MVALDSSGAVPEGYPSVQECFKLLQISIVGQRWKHLIFKLSTIEMCTE